MLRFLIPLLALATLPAISQPVLKTLDLSTEAVGDEPKSLLSMAGNWLIAQENGRKFLKVDGTNWPQGQSGANLADKARAIFGERHVEFLDSVKAHADYPYVVATGVESFSGGVITVRFKALAGQVDQGAGILFNLQPNGDYLALRANALENNLVLWRVVKGRRSAVKEVRNTPTTTLQWHDLKVVVRGLKVQGYLDGKLYLESMLTAPVSGKVGLWSKADSVVLFDDFQITAGP